MSDGDDAAYNNYNDKLSELSEEEGYDLLWVVSPSPPPPCLFHVSSPDRLFVLVCAMRLGHYHMCAMLCHWQCGQTGGCSDPAHPGPHECCGLLLSVAC
jgi:hypothetical protein